MLLPQNRQFRFAVFRKIVNFVLSFFRKIVNFDAL